MAVELGDYDWVILMHDDVQMDDLAYVDKLQEAFKEYDVVGLAGANNVLMDRFRLHHAPLALANVQQAAASIVLGVAQRVSRYQIVCLGQGWIVTISSRQ